MPTRRGFALFAAGTALIVAGRFLALIELGTVGLVLSGVVVCMMASVGLQTFRARHLQRLTITRTHTPAYVFANRPFTVTLRADARHRRIPLGTVTEAVGRIGPTDQDPASAGTDPDTDPWGQGADSRTITAGLCRTGDLHYQRRFPRGVHRLGPGKVTVVDSLGLARLPLMRIPTTQVLVWPEAVELEPALVDHLFARSRSGMDTEPGDLREYVVGDDLRRVHWATSARAAKLMVRDVEKITRSHEARRLIVDVTSSSHRGHTFELALSVAASLLVSAPPDDRIDLILDGPSGPRVYSTLGLAMAALAGAVPDHHRPTDASMTALEWNSGVVVIGELTPVPFHANGPIIQCAGGSLGDVVPPGQLLMRVTSVSQLGEALDDLEHSSTRRPGTRSTR